MSVSEQLGSIKERKKRQIEMMKQFELLKSQDPQASYGYGLALKRPSIMKMLGENPLADDEFEQIKHMLKIKKERLS